MQRIRILVLLLFTCLLITRLVGHAQDTVTSTKESVPPKLRIPRATWEPIFFDSINERARQSKLANLRTYSVPPGDIEVRLWEGFGITRLQGIRLQRTRGIWSGTWLSPATEKFAGTDYKKPLPAPKSGWILFWERLVQAGFTTRPDSSTLPDDDFVVRDGMSYVVEINRERTYRTYCYENPDMHKRWADKKMVELIKIIDEEFRMKEITGAFYVETEKAASAKKP